MASRQSRRATSRTLVQQNDEPRSVEDPAQGAIQGACEGALIVPLPKGKNAKESLAEAGGKRKHTEVEVLAGTGPVAGERWRHVVRDGLAGAVPPRTRPLHSSRLVQPPILPSILNCAVEHSDTGAYEELLRRAKRLCLSAFLDETCSTKLSNVDELTDGLMVVALEALEAAAAALEYEEGPTAQRRLLGKLIAGAMGQVLAPTYDLKLIGNRIDKQAQKVRGQLAAVSLEAVAARADADAAAVAEVDASESKQLDKLRLEPYIGFTVESCIPPQNTWQQRPLPSL